MKVWIVNPFDNLPLEGTRPQRYWLMARAFVRGGHEVTYWTADFSHAHKRQRKFITGNPDDFDLRLIHEPSYPKNICFRRIYAHWRFARNWLSAAQMGTDPQQMGTDPQQMGTDPRQMGTVPQQMGTDPRQMGTVPQQMGTVPQQMGTVPRQSENRKIEKSKICLADLVIVSSPPLSLVAAVRKFCRQTGAKLIIDVQDAWPETFYRVLPSWMLWPLKVLAQRNYCSADAISAVSQQYIDLVRSYGASCPTHRCYHGIDLGKWGQSPLNSPLNRKIKESKNLKIFRLVYAGNMSLSYDLATVIEVVKLLEGVEFDLAGTGPDEERLKELAGECMRIRFHGYLGEEALGELLSMADAGVIPMFPESCVGIPGKLADYVAVGLPVINSLTGEAAEILAESGAGEVYSAGNADSLKAVLVRWMENWRKESEGWQKLREAATSLAVAFDATTLYDGYRKFAEGIVISTSAD